MVLIVRSCSLDPYRKADEYKQKTVERDVEFDGVIYRKKIVYERRLGDRVYRLALGALALFATMSVVFAIIESQRIIGWWKESLFGVDQKIVLIQDRPSFDIDSGLSEEETGQKGKKVLFGAVRGRVFNRSHSPSKVGELASIQMGDAGIMQYENLLNQEQERGEPPLSTSDTTVWSSDKVPLSVHGTGKLFEDTDITEKLPLIGRRRIKKGDNIYAFYTKNMKTIIQQQSKRGCTAAAAAMLIMDYGKEPDLSTLRMRNIGSDHRISQDIEKAGLKPLIGSTVKLDDLRNFVKENGSCIVKTQGTFGGHVVIVDDISEDLSKISLRDPYHGWGITVTKDAFCKEWQGGLTIQIKGDQDTAEFS